MNEESLVVAVLGASANLDRYSNQAVVRLLSAGHQVIPVNPGLKELYGLDVVPDLGSITDPVDVLTVYLGERRIGQHMEAIVDLKPRRVILNPGAESQELEDALDRAGIKWEHACTLVLLNTGQFAQL